MAAPPRKPPGPRRRRAIAPEDRALWREVISDATPLDPELRNPPETPPPADPPEPPGDAPPAAPLPIPPDPLPPLPPRRLRPTGLARPSSISFDLVNREVAPVGRPQAGLDSRNADRLRRGERAPDARVDLHGMSAERAHLALDRSIGAALAAGARLVLVITGKGGKRRDPHAAPFMRGDQGVLRQQVPGWLARGPHSRHIVGVYQAHPRHGGAGALYVYLKKWR